MLQKQPSHVLVPAHHARHSDPLASFLESCRLGIGPDVAGSWPRLDRGGEAARDGACYFRPAFRSNDLARHQHARLRSRWLRLCHLEQSHRQGGAGSPNTAISAGHTRVSGCLETKRLGCFAKSKKRCALWSGDTSFQVRFLVFCSIRLRPFCPGSNPSPVEHPAS